MVFFGLEAENYDREYTDRELFSRISKYFKKYKKEMKIMILFILFESIFTAIQPFYMYYLINQIKNNVELTTLLIVGQMVLLLIHTITWRFSVIRQIYTARIINKVVFDLRIDVNENVLIQDMSFFDQYSTGRIVSRINSDTEQFGEMVDIFVQAVSSIVAIIFLIPPMASIDFQLTIVFLIAVPFVFIFTLSFRKIARKKTILGQRALGAVNSFVQETMAGISIAKTFRQEEKFYNEFSEVNDQSYRVNFSRSMFMNIIFPGLYFIESLTLVFSVFYGGQLIVNNAVITSEQLYLFIQSIWSIYFPIFRIASFWPQFQAGMAAAERTFSLIDISPIVSQNKSIILEKMEGKIKFDKLSFQYTSEQPVFQNLNLLIKPGESIAIVGHTGAGKSSLARILMRFYEYQDGNIYIDENDIRDLSLKEYRNFIGMIPQTPFLWADTIENNVKYGTPNASREDVLWALEQAGGRDWIEDLADGIETNIRERGKLLSMGQRQLVVFARILIQNPSILILDEATASVDPFTETKIQEAMDHIMKDRTSIIIAHRLRTVKHVDRIIVLDHGTIVEEGNHDYLMEKGGHYADLYNKYFKHQSYEFVEKAKERLVAEN